MNLQTTLSDNDILELNSLCNSLVDGSIGEEDFAKLSQWLKKSEDARQFYVRMAGLSASLCSYAGEMQSEAPDAVHPSALARRLKWLSAIVSIAACLALFFWITRPKPPAAPVAKGASDENEFVARLTGAKECEWLDHAVIPPNGRLHKGQKLNLAKGFAEITFDSGAQILLQGPASLDINSAWNATLNRGTLKASLPPEAMGFAINNPTVEVVDNGTEFTMFTDASGAATEVLVLKGEVEAAPKTPAEQQPIVLREKEARLFANSGVSGVRDSDRKFAEMSRPVPLDHFDSPPAYAHWSFNETTGSSFKGDSAGLSFPANDVEIPSSFELTAANHVKGKRDAGLHFDGKLFANVLFPDISDNSAHTIAFWVKVPKDANLSNAYAMIAWAGVRNQFGVHPVHVSWNRKADEGPFGVLRTDYGGGHALGTTQLRDGHWHHIAVVFIPKADSESPVEVKQYVDGRLDGEGHPSPPGSDIFMSSTDFTQSTAGTIWLGCRLGIKGVRTDRFAGDIDELFIADRALEPQDIVRLMNENQL